MWLGKFVCVCVYVCVDILDITVAETGILGSNL